LKPAAKLFIQQFDSLKERSASSSSADASQAPDAPISVDSIKSNESALSSAEAQKLEVRTEKSNLEIADTSSSYDSVDVDSVIYSNLLSDTLQVPKPLFESHELITSRSQSNAMSAKTPDWMLGVLLLTFLLIAWVRVYHSRRLKQLYQALTSKLYVQHILRTNDGLMQRVSFVLDVISYLVMATFLFQVTQFFGLNIPYSDYLHPYVLMLLALFLLYQIKNITLIMSGVLLNQQEKLREYRFNVFLMNKTLGLVLTPIIIFIAYLSFGEAVNIWIGIILMVVAYLYRINRGLAIGLKEANASVFYLFMYLCTLEILPLVVLTRLILDFN